MVNKKCLSEHDRSVLNAIFNPSEIGGDISNINNNYDDEELPEQLQDAEIEKTSDWLESERIETEAVKEAENKNFDLSIAKFQQAIDLTPNRGSIYNNRAQVYRLIGNDDSALVDLEEAIKLSKGIGRTGCRALCQRGLLRRKQHLDDAAKEDFSKASKLGSQFARNQLIEMNPYAAMCNQMLRNAFDKLS